MDATSLVQRRFGDRAVRASMTLTVLGVAAVAGWVSYWHAVEVVLRYGAEDPVTAHLVPLTVDGMLYSSSMVLLWCARYRLRVPVLAWFAMGLGIAATLAANVLHGIEQGILAAALAAWPAVALVFAYELSMWVVRSGRELADHHPTTSETKGGEPAANTQAGRMNRARRPLPATRS